MTAVPTANPVPESAGELPEGRREAGPPAPLDLPRLVMRRAAAVAVAALLLATVLGLWRVREDTAQEVEGAVALAQLARQISTLPTQPDAAALEGLSGLPLRHLQLRVTDASGHILLSERGDGAAGAPLSWLLAAQRSVGATAPSHTVSWPVARPDGQPWTVTLIASPDSEQLEALENLLGMFVLLAAVSAAMLAAMHWNARRAFRPLQALLGAIARVDRQGLEAVRALPPMPIRELEAIAAALRHLAASIDSAEAARRVLAQKMLSLQESERQALARDLHDEFGQRLTALRVDAAWLQKRLDGLTELQGVAGDMSARVGDIQGDLRGLLARLRPLALDDTPEGDTGARLRTLLEDLVAGWSATPGPSARIDLSIEPAEAASFDAAPLPRALLIAVYRISQEALTNVARHADASRARLAVRLDSGPAGGVLTWSVEDDGRGLDRSATATQRGDGLAGIQDRVWTLGGDLVLQPGAGGRGLRLQARLPYERPSTVLPTRAIVSAENP